MYIYYICIYNYIIIYNEYIYIYIPIGSMYAIYGNIYHQYIPNVSIYTAIHGSYGIYLEIHGMYIHMYLSYVQSPAPQADIILGGPRRFLVDWWMFYCMEGRDTFQWNRVSLLKNQQRFVENPHESPNKKRINSCAFQLAHLPSGNLLHSYWKWPFIVSFPIKNGGSFHSYVSSPEGNEIHLFSCWRRCVFFVSPAAG